MSVVPPGIEPPYGGNLYGYVQVAVTTAALYDHALTLRREVDLVWKKPVSLVTALYVVDRYLGDAVLLAGLYLWFTESTSEHQLQGVCVYLFNYGSLLSKFMLYRCLQLFRFRAWGALAYSWTTQATMQLRIWAMYRRTNKILFLLLILFVCEIAAITVIIWRTIGPQSSLQVISGVNPGRQYCVFSGINQNFIYLFIPFLCFESALFLLASRVFIDNMRRNREQRDEKGFRVNSFMSVLARDSFCYFFVNLIACAVVMGLWKNIDPLYANVCVPLVMFLEILVGTRLVLDFRGRYTRLDKRDPVVRVSGRFSSLHLRGDNVHMESLQISVRCDVETVVNKDEFEEVL